MVPSTWLSVVLFLLLVAPGLFFDLLAERRRVGVPESTFREASRIVLASLFFSGLGVLVLIVLRVLIPTWMLDPDRLINEGGAYITDHFQLVFYAFGVWAIVAFLTAWGAHAFFARRHGVRFRPVSTWQKLIRDECPAGYVPHARVRLTNGTVYLGRVEHYTADLDLADRELVLVPPLFSKTGDRPLAPIPKEWQRVVVHGSAIESIAVQYAPPPQGE